MILWISTPFWHDSVDKLPLAKQSKQLWQLTPPAKLASNMRNMRKEREIIKLADVITGIAGGVLRTVIKLKI